MPTLYAKGEAIAGGRLTVRCANSVAYRARRSLATEGQGFGSAPPELFAWNLSRANIALLIGSILHIGWRIACIGFLASRRGLRARRYGPFSWSEANDARLGEAMVQVGNWFIWPWAVTTLNSVYLIVAVPVLVVLMRKRLIERQEGRWHFRPLLISLICTGAAWVHYVFDLSPAISESDP